MAFVLRLQLCQNPIAPDQLLHVLYAHMQSIDDDDDNMALVVLQSVGAIFQQTKSLVTVCGFFYCQTLL